LIGPALGGEGGIAHHYQNALNDIHRELRHPLVQRKVFSLASASPKEILRARLSTNEIQHRALTYIPEDMLLDIPKTDNSFSLFQGFEATLPDPAETSKRKGHGRHASRGRKLIGAGEDEGNTPPDMLKLKQDRDAVNHKLETLTIRKNMCSTEIYEIDNKIANLNTMRKIVLDRLAGLEQEESHLENDLLDVDTKMDELQEEIEDQAALAGAEHETPPAPIRAETPEIIDSPSVGDESFMSESIYNKIPSPKAKRPRPSKRRSNFILHEHLQAGSQIRELQAHNDIVTALDFDVPFGTMVSSALDDTVRVWDLNAGRCIGLLEGHLSSVRCLQVEDNLVATGSMDASVRLWDLSQADYAPRIDSSINKNTGSDDEDEYAFADHPTNMASSMADCEIFNLSSHVAEVTALHFRNSTLVSGSADKTLRQWDLVKGRCVQTMDVLWAAAQAAVNINPPAQANNLFGGSSTDPSSLWRQAGRLPDANADFVGALQVFDAALACGTADGMVRLWDLRSGQVHRSLVGHTGPVTCLQFDDVHLVTGSLDRSIRVSSN
jgi:division protein 1